MVLQTCDQCTVVTSCWCQVTMLNWPCFHPASSEWSASPTPAMKRVNSRPSSTDELGWEAGTACLSAKAKRASQPPTLQSEERGFKAWCSEWLPFDGKRKRARRCLGQFKVLIQHQNIDAWRYCLQEMLHTRSESNVALPVQKAHLTSMPCPAQASRRRSHIQSSLIWKGELRLSSCGVSRE